MTAAMAPAGRLRGANRLDRLVASDPGLNRLTSAARAVGGVATALGVEYVVASLTGQPALVPMMLGAVVSMMAAFALSDATRGGQAGTLLSLPLFMFAGMGVAIAVDRFRLASLLVFVVVMFAAVFIRRFGPRYFIGGMIAFMGYFFALFLGLTLPALPAVALAVLVAVAWSMVLHLVLFPVHNDRVLRRMLRAFEARARAVGDAAADLLAAPDSGGE
ncbi:MAG: FUSC family protein, partial [Actinomycetes bacterium]